MLSAKIANRDYLGLLEFRIACVEQDVSGIVLDDDGNEYRFDEFGRPTGYHEHPAEVLDHDLLGSLLTKQREKHKVSKDAWRSSSDGLAQPRKAHYSNRDILGLVEFRHTLIDDDIGAIVTDDDGNEHHFNNFAVPVPSNSCHPAMKLVNDLLNDLVVKQMEKSRRCREAEMRGNKPN